MLFHILYKDELGGWHVLEEYVPRYAVMQACAWYEAIGFTVRIDPA